MKATIEIRNLEIYAYIGCFEEEQTVGNRFIIDADLEINAALAAVSDDVGNALNYVEVCECLREVVLEKRHLLETTVSAMVQELHVRFDRRGLLGGWVRLRKMAPPIGMQMESVGLRVEL